LKNSLFPAEQERGGAFAPSLVLAFALIFKGCTFRFHLAVVDHGVADVDVIGGTSPVLIIRTLPHLAVDVQCGIRGFVVRGVAGRAVSLIDEICAVSLICRDRLRPAYHDIRPAAEIIPVIRTVFNVAVKIRHFGASFLQIVFRGYFVPDGFFYSKCFKCGQPPVKERRSVLWRDRDVQQSGMDRTLPGLPGSL
jgi:hypothetical protein